MSDLRLVHMSDLHFSNTYKNLQPDDALQLAGSALGGEFGDAPLVLLISGDITTKGDLNGYNEALGSIKRHLLEKLNVVKIILCPGNHDIVSGDKSFSAFNKFAFA